MTEGVRLWWLLW